MQLSCITMATGPQNPWRGTQYLRTGEIQLTVKLFRKNPKERLGKSCRQQNREASVDKGEGPESRGCWGGRTGQKLAAGHG